MSPACPAKAKATEKRSRRKKSVGRKTAGEKKKRDRDPMARASAETPSEHLENVERANVIYIHKFNTRQVAVTSL